MLIFQLLKEEADVKEALERHKKSKEFKKQEILSAKNRSEFPAEYTPNKNVCNSLKF